MTYEQMEAKTNEALETAQETVKLFNSTKNKKVKDNLRDNLKHDLNKLYMKYDKDNDRFIINDILPKLELYNHKINLKIYKSGLNMAKGYEDNGIKTVRVDYIKVDDSISTKKQSFREAFLQYAELIKENQFAPRLLELENEQPLIRSAYYKLGVDKVKSMRYVKKSVENALTSLENDKTTEQKLAKMITNSIETPTSITVAKANSIIDEAYQQLEIKHKAKAKELHKWFECSDPLSKRIDGKVTKVVEIFRAKFIFN